MGKCGKTIGTGSKLIENFNLSRQLDDILGEERDYTCTNGFKPGLFWEIGWNWIRILRHMLIPSSGLQGFCDEVELHSNDCPYRYGCSCKGVTIYRDQFIQRLH
ncbi:uncharacterized protein LOC123305976 isoform X1 [Chrysoperla carnea]|uniref:uncharacterized protein LOC123305976 isoform X1 n=1 Tax=Chrysoperla carnea TaxID=189513 RepID=UPI001D0697F7|nr:uncharacterized protein LOC123305976 isoform X1 [Chrysoperla carnea]